MAIIGRKKYKDKTEEEVTEWVIEQMKEDYIKGNISLERFEEYVEKRLQGETPVDSEGMPIYYEDHLLNNTGLYYVA